jgi:hypothetical protein
MTQINDGPEQGKVDVYNIVLSCRQKISTEYVRRGDSGALVSAACGSIVFAALIEAGSLRADAIDMLEETLSNLGVRQRIGDDITDIFLDTGPQLFDQVADIWSRRTIQVAA